MLKYWSTKNTRTACKKSFNYGIFRLAMCFVALCFIFLCFFIFCVAFIFHFIGNVMHNEFLLHAAHRNCIHSQSFWVHIHKYPYLAVIMFSVEITSNKMFKRTHFKQNNEFGAAATAAAAAQAPAIV